MRKICLALMLAPVLAWAEPRSAADWYKEGETQYSLQNFDKAVEAFKQGFALETEESKKPAYLFNVAQSYRQANDCKNAYFYYKRFLALWDKNAGKPLPSATRHQVEDRIKELEACAQQAAQISNKPPNSNLPPDGETERQAPGETPRKEPPSKRVGTAQGQGQGQGPGSNGDQDEGAGVEASATPEGPHLISARLIGGPSVVSAGKNSVPVQPTFALIAGYPIAVMPKLTVEAGAGLTFTPIPYDPKMPGGPKKTGMLWGVLANAAATYEVIPKLGLRLDLGLGALIFSGISESPFTGGQTTTGALTMFHVRSAVSAEYAVTPNLVVIATPFGFTYSPPKSGLVADIKSITSFDFLVGVGYRK
jgi:hypothetical protein